MNNEEIKVMCEATSDLVYRPSEWEDYTIEEDLEETMKTCKNLQQRIDKAIEYIEHNITKINKEEYELWLICGEVDHLLEILGEENESNRFIK